MEKLTEKKHFTNQKNGSIFHIVIEVMDFRVQSFLMKSEKADKSKLSSAAMNLFKCLTCMVNMCTDNCMVNMCTDNCMVNMCTDNCVPEFSWLIFIIFSWAALSRFLR